MTRSKLIIIVSLFLVIFDNIRFFTNTLNVYPLIQKNMPFLISLAVLITCINIIILALISNRYILKPVIISLFLSASLAAYFMDTYDIIIDDSMITNILNTDYNEMTELIDKKLLLYLFTLGIAPSIIVYKTKITRHSLKKEIISKCSLFGCSLILPAVILFTFGDFYASFFREHKPLRYYTNPDYYLYSIGKFIGNSAKKETVPLKKIALDATMPPSTSHKLIIFVVGESARADHFSLNGYSRKTNPLLEKEAVINFTNVWSCGTSTAYSVPCLFSIYKQSDFSIDQASTTENILDVLQRSGVSVLWLDNNSDSKGVANRIPYTSYRTTRTNPVCDSECRDIGMLANLQAYINAHQKKDIFIVLHQMGNHGPAYYKRYPSEFEKFTPTCQTNQLEQCSREEINNAYDNALLYTDYFLSRIISLLKKNTRFEAAMLYISDHGESLGENGLYLHGYPYLIAPDSQTHVPLVIWFNKNFENRLNSEHLNAIADIRLSHDNIFHSILGLIGIKTQSYNKKLDIFSHAE